MVHPTNVILLGEGLDIGEKLVPSWLSLVVQLGAFAILLIVVIFLAYKPVKKMLKKRADFIEQNINDAQKSKAIADKNALESQETIIASKKEAASIIEAANKAATLSPVKPQIKVQLKSPRKLKNNENKNSRKAIRIYH